ncbi:MAG TPA: hypothetical protein VK897_22940 [Anaerolineales bacterium]|nr:hypothetical protein [Anaerolineales bacterium]
MQKRYIYSLLFGIPGLFVAGIISIFALGAFTGILWLFVFGDHPWPVSAETILSILFVVVFLILWAGIILLGYWMGRRLENDPTLNRKHVFISAGLTLMFILFMVIYQWRVGNIGAQSDSALCSEFCAQHGFSGSGMPPENSGNRICSCYDDAGNEALRIPLDQIAPDHP